MHRDQTARPLNVRADLLRELKTLIQAENDAAQVEDGKPALLIATSSHQLAVAATTMAEAFVHSRDKAWLAWFRPEDVAAVHAGNTGRVQLKLARVIRYLCEAALFNGGVVILATRLGEHGPVITGASLWVLPPERQCPEPIWHKYGRGAVAAWRAYGAWRSLAADHAASRLVQASSQAMARLGITDHVYGQMGGVAPAWLGHRVSSRMGAPFRAQCDRHGLVYWIESSNPEANDTRVFSRFRFEPVGEYGFEASRLNSVGAYRVTLMMRRPASLSQPPADR